MFMKKYETLVERYIRLRSSPECQRYDEEHGILLYHQQILDEIHDNEMRMTKWQKFKRWIKEFIESLAYIT